MDPFQDLEKFKGTGADPETGGLGTALGTQRLTLSCDIAGSSLPLILLIVTMNQTISWPPVLTSGAGTSDHAPTTGSILAAKVLATRSFSPLDISRGLHSTHPSLRRREYLQGNTSRS